MENIKEIQEIYFENEVLILQTIDNSYYVNDNESFIYELFNNWYDEMDMNIETFINESSIEEVVKSLPVISIINNCNSWHSIPFQVFLNEFLVKL